MSNTKSIIEFDLGQFEGCKRISKDNIYQTFSPNIKNLKERFLFHVSRDIEKVHRTPKHSGMSVT